jgi:hypothetical protein
MPFLPVDIVDFVFAKLISYFQPTTTSWLQTNAKDKLLHRTFLLLGSNTLPLKKDSAIAYRPAEDRISCNKIFKKCSIPLETPYI